MQLFRKKETQSEKEPDIEDVLKTELGIDLEKAKERYVQKMSEKEKRRLRYEHEMAEREKFRSRVETTAREWVKNGNLVVFVGNTRVLDMTDLKCPACGASNVNMAGYIEAYTEEVIRNTPFHQAYGFFAVNGAYRIPVMYHAFPCPHCQAGITEIIHAIWQPE